MSAQTGAMTSTGREYKPYSAYTSTVPDMKSCCSHCFDYLRASIMCYADPTLESVSLQPGPANDGKVVKVIDGGAEVRYCRDTRPLYELERRYGPNSQYGFSKDQFEVAPGK
jgi:hypothetical protein